MFNNGNNSKCSVFASFLCPLSAVEMKTANLSEIYCSSSRHKLWRIPQPRDLISASAVRESRKLTISMKGKESERNTLGIPVRENTPINTYVYTLSSFVQ